MTTKIQLTHPAGKRAVTMEAGKYNLMTEAILGKLAKGGSTHTEMLQAVTNDFATKGTKFPGSMEWHMEWVKLDLEAKNQIKRKDSSPATFDLVRA